MTVALSKESQTNFFIKVYGEGWTTANIVPLLDKGVVINVEFTAISATFNGNYQKVSLSMNTTALMKGASSLMANDNRKIIQNFIHGLPGKYFTPEEASALLTGMWFMDDNGVACKPALGTSGGWKVPTPGEAPVKFEAWAAGGGGGAGGNGIGVFAPAGQGGAGGSGLPAASGGGGGMGSNSFTIKYVPTDPKFPDGGLSASAEKLKSVLAEKAAMFKAAPAMPTINITSTDDFLKQLDAIAPAKPPKAAKPVKGVIKLRDATKIGQAVQGTSSGSVYTVIALNPRVKVAARLQGSGVSIRAEFDNAKSNEVESLKKFGLSHSGGEHLSMHLDCQDVPPSRVIGAFLLDSGVEFDSQITSLKGVLQ